MNRAVQRCAIFAVAAAFLLPLRLGSQQERAPLRAEVNLVTLIASVLDANGRPRAELPREAFAIFEEGRAQNVAVFESETQQPLDLALMMDTSLSTLKEFRFEQEAAAHFIRQVVRPGDRLAVFAFSDVVTQLSAFSAEVPALQAAVRQMEPGAGTALYDAIYLGAQALGEQPGGRRRAIVLVTDAGETTSRTPFEEARQAALRAETMLYTLVVRPVKAEGGRNTAGEHALVTITDVAGGALYFPESPAAFEGVFDRIDAELRTQYRLGYYPEPRPPARSYRRVELRVAGCGEPAPVRDTRGCVLRYRKGYFTAGAPE